MAWAVGVDLGGTNVRAAQVDEAGTVGSVLFEPLDPGRSTRPFSRLIDMPASRIGKAAGDPPVGIGVGATGPVDPARGVISNPDTLPGAYQGAVTQVLAEAFGVPVWLADDADAAGVGGAGDRRRRRGGRGGLPHNRHRHRRRRDLRRPDLPRRGRQPSRGGPPCRGPRL